MGRRHVFGLAAAALALAGCGEGLAGGRAARNALARDRTRSCGGRERIEIEEPFRVVHGALCAPDGSGASSPVGAFYQGRLGEHFAALPKLAPTFDTRNATDKRYDALEGMETARAARVVGCHEKIGFVLEGSDDGATLFLRVAPSRANQGNFSGVAEHDRVSQLVRPRAAGMGDEWRVGVVEWFDRPRFEKHFGPIRPREACRAEWAALESSGGRFEGDKFAAVYPDGEVFPGADAAPKVSSEDMLLAKLRALPPPGKTLRERFRDARVLLEVAEVYEASRTKSSRVYDELVRRNAFFASPLRTKMPTVAEFDAFVRSFEAKHPDVENEPLTKKADVAMPGTTGPEFKANALLLFVSAVGTAWLHDVLLAEADRLRDTRPFEALALEVFLHERLQVLGPDKARDAVAGRAGSHAEALVAPLVPEMRVTGTDTPRLWGHVLEGGALPLARTLKTTPRGRGPGAVQIVATPMSCASGVTDTFAQERVTRTVTTAATGGATSAQVADAAGMNARLAEIAREREFQRERLAWKNAGEKGVVYDSKRCGGVGQAECPKTSEIQGGGPSGAESWVHGDAEARIRALDAEKAQIEAKLVALGASITPTKAPETRTEDVGTRLTTVKEMRTKCVVDLTITLPDRKVVTARIAPSVFGNDAKATNEARQAALHAISVEVEKAMEPVILANVPAYLDGIAARDAREGAFARRLFAAPMLRTVDETTGSVGPGLAPVWP
ncbi:MAG: hypothetical protein U0169_15265 [Polyangiaceae bacterium]